MLSAQYVALLFMACCIYYLVYYPTSTEQQLIVRIPLSDPQPSQPPPMPRASPPPALAADSVSALSLLLKPRVRRKGVRSCVELSAWDSSHFSAEQDWVPLADGQAVAADTMWQLQRAGQAVHLRNKGNGGHINFRPGGFVRYHGNEVKEPRRPAPATDSTALIRTEVAYGQYAEVVETRDCAWDASYSTFQFQKSRMFLHVDEDGSLAARKDACSDDISCLFAVESAAGHAGWVVVRSALTGRLVRMVGNAHPPFDGWDGIGRPKAVAKDAATLKRQQSAAEEALGGTSRCPLRTDATPPASWAYNASAYGPLIRRALAPWYDGHLSATAVDIAFWHEMYPYANRYERPSLHVALSAARVFSIWQPAAPRAGEPAARADPRGGPPRASADATYLEMLHQVSQLVELPDVEWVAHTASLPKVPAQNLELVLAPSTTRAHNDVPAPSPWLYAALREPGASGGQGGDTLRSCPSGGRRRRQLLLLADCEGPEDGYRGPLYRFYSPHRAALLSTRPELRGRLVVRLTHACTGPPAEGLPLESKWDAKAAAELAQEVGGALVGGGLGESAADEHGLACGYRWELVVDGQVHSRCHCGPCQRTLRPAHPACQRTSC